MTFSQFAERLRARPVRNGRCMAPCPAHPDKTDSLSITSGRNGGIVLHCFAGCRTVDVLKAMGLGWADISGTPMTPAQAREAAIARRQQEEHRHRQRVTERVAFDRIRKLHAVADELGSRLANNPDAPGSDAVAGLFHQALDKLREAEGAVTHE
jgi:hypothetical protein